MQACLESHSQFATQETAQKEYVACAHPLFKSVLLKLHAFQSCLIKRSICLIHPKHMHVTSYFIAWAVRAHTRVY